MAAAAHSPGKEHAAEGRCACLCQLDAGRGREMRRVACVSMCMGVEAYPPFLFFFVPFLLAQQQQW
jgi:hypothetical protein